jgi:hypothetical protein
MGGYAGQRSSMENNAAYGGMAAEPMAANAVLGSSGASF